LDIGLVNNQIKIKEDNMENTLNIDNTFVAGSKWMLKVINNLKNRLHIPESTKWFSRIILHFAPSRLGIYALITLMTIAFMVTAPLFAGPNYILHSIGKAKSWVFGRYGSGNSLVKR